MNYWLNVHWPSLKRDKPTPSSRDPIWHYWVFLPDDGRQVAGERLEKDDEIFIYESKTGRPLENGKHYTVGKEGVIALVAALGPIYPKRNEEPDYYADGTSICWRWRAETRLLREGFVSRRDVCQAIGFDKNYTFRGFGDRHSGLKLLNETQYYALKDAFT
jgi:hypothetical protein